MPPDDLNEIMAKLAGQIPEREETPVENMEAFAQFFQDLDKTVEDAPILRTETAEGSPTDGTESGVETSPPVEAGTPTSPSDTAPPPSLLKPSGSTEDAHSPGAQAADGTAESPEADLSTSDQPQEKFYTVTYQGQEHQLNEATMQYLLDTGSWAQNLPDGLRRSFAAIEQGEAVAIPVAELREFAEWKKSKSEPQIPDYEFDDPDAAKAFKAMRDEITTLRRQVQPVDDDLPAPIYYHQQQQGQAEFDAMAARINNASEAYKQAHGLNDMEYNYLVNKVGEAQIVEPLVKRMTTYSPTGQILQYPNYEQAINIAYDYILNQLPELAHRTTSSNSASTPNPPVQVPNNSPIPTHQQNVVPIKRARASSLASAPSTSASVPPKSPQQMSPQELTDAMAGFIRDLGDEAVN